jgi:hypothetical protein
MTLDEAHALESQIAQAEKQLVAAYPCMECDGTGNLNHKNMPYPDICEECWGRGYRVPYEGEEEEGE